VSGRSFVHVDGSPSLIPTLASARHVAPRRRAHRRRFIPAERFLVVCAQSA